MLPQHGADAATRMLRRCLQSVVHGSALLTLSLLMAGLDAAPAASQQLQLDFPTFYTRRPPKDTPVDVLAEKLIYDSRKDVATAIGRVQITWGPYVLLARKVVYNRRTDRFHAEGEVYIREPNGNILMADLLDIDEKFRDGFARHLRLLMTNGATLKARYAVRRDGNITTYTDVAYTACKTCRLASGTPIWEIRSEQAVHNEEKGRIYHRNMTMRIAGVPVFWLPWISHPDPQHPRSSGFLVPTATYDKYRGFSLATPYFINLAPNYDITLMPQFSSSQGVLARAQWRHNLGAGTYKVDGGAIYQLKPGLMPADERDRTRWFVKGKGEFAINRAWSWGFEGAAQSDLRMMRRYGVDSRSVLHNHAWLRGLQGRNYFRAEAGRYESLNDADHRNLDPATLPWVHHEYTFEPAVLGGVLSFSSDLYAIFRDQGGLPISAAPLAHRNVRLATITSWQRQWITPAGILLQPFMTLRNELRYAKDVPDSANPSSLRDRKLGLRSFPSAGLDVRWPFMATHEGGYQVLSPVAQIIMAPSEHGRRKAGNEDALAPHFSAANLLQPQRFPGLDRFEGGVRANVGLIWDVYHDEDGSAFSLFAGQSFHLAGRNSFRDTATGLQGKRSDIVLGVTLQAANHMALSWRGRFDPDSFKPRDQEAEVDFTLDRLSLNLKYARLVPTPEYGYSNTDDKFSAYGSMQIFDQWRLYAGLNYQADDSRWSINRQIGIGYECDCLNVKLIYSEGVSSSTSEIFNRSISLSIEFKTLGTLAANAPLQ